MVDDEFVAPVRPERGLHRAGDGSAGVDVAQYCAIFGVVAIRCVSIAVSTILGEDANFW